MRHFFVLLILASACACTPAPDPKVPNLIPTKGEMPCTREPTAYLVGQTVHPDSASACYAVAKIQAIAYECGLEEDTSIFTRDALLLNIEVAKKKCNEFCQKLSDRCEGVLTAPEKCGLVSPPGKALDFGKNSINCPKRCKGQAFNYCSIYHGNFFATSEPALFANVKENCTCRKKQ